MDREAKIQQLLDLVERIVFVHMQHSVPPEVEGMDELRRLINELRGSQSKQHG